MIRYGVEDVPGPGRADAAARTGRTGGVAADNRHGRGPLFTVYTVAVVAVSAIALAVTWTNGRDRGARSPSSG